jgi:hypothetical protein
LKSGQVNIALDMTYRTKCFVTHTVELVQIDNTASLESLHGILGETIAYGIREKELPKRRKLIKLRDNTALNVVQVEDEPLAVFMLVLPTTAGGFHFIYNQLGPTVSFTTVLVSNQMTSPWPCSGGSASRW